MPEQIITDNGMPFRSIEFNQFCNKDRTEVTYASVSYAKTNGKIERYQGVSCKMIAKALAASSDRQSKWGNYLAQAV